jgi:hypothetical protein
MLEVMVRSGAPELLSRVRLLLPASATPDVADEVDRDGGGSGADTGGRAAPDVAVALEGGDGGGAGGVGDRAFPEPSIGPTTY